MLYIKNLSVAIIAIAILVYGISFLWPVYTWDLALASPDGSYELVVLRGDAAAFDDYSYHVYLFPRPDAPHDQAKNSRVWFTERWRGRKYRIYSGYNYPMFRWTSPHSVEIDLTDLHIEAFELEPVKRFSGSRDAVFIATAFGRTDKGNTMP
jgi:hypothetical protein